LSQVAVAERPAAYRKASFSGAWLLSGAMVVSGVLTYAFHVLAARTLGPSAYGQIAVLWGGLFLVAIVLFRPVEQPVEKLIQGPLADALTHVGQLAMLRGMAGAPIRPESYARADIVVGRISLEQTPPRAPFDGDASIRT